MSYHVIRKSEASFTFFVSLHLAKFYLIFMEIRTTVLIQSTCDSAIHRQPHKASIRLVRFPTEQARHTPPFTFFYTYSRLLYRVHLPEANQLFKSSASASAILCAVLYQSPPVFVSICFAKFLYIKYSPRLSTSIHTTSCSVQLRRPPSPHCA
jgi:hypothetical protein